MDNHSAMHPGVKLRHIRAFLDIAAEGGLTAVARVQGITQPALSRTLAELEALMGQPLFLRQGRKLVLTEAGALFRRHALAGIQALEAGAAALRPGAGGVLRIGVLPTVATRFIPRVMLAFREMNPETVLSVETGPHFHLMRLLRDGAVELMVGHLPAASEMAGLSFDHFYEEEVILAARAGHPGLGETVAGLLERFPGDSAAAKRADPSGGRNLSGLAGVGGAASGGGNRVAGGRARAVPGLGRAVVHLKRGDRA